MSGLIQSQPLPGADNGSFYALLNGLYKSDPKLAAYVQRRAVLETKKLYLRAKAEAECTLIDKKIRAIRAQEHNRAEALGSRFIAKRRKELGLSPLKR